MSRESDAGYAIRNTGYGLHLNMFEILKHLKTQVCQ